MTPRLLKPLELSPNLRRSGLGPACGSAHVSAGTKTVTPGSLQIGEIGSLEESGRERIRAAEIAPPHRNAILMREWKIQAFVKLHA